MTSPELLPKAKRSPRFERPILRTNVQLTERDLDILEVVADCRFMRSNHITQVVAGNPVKIVQRLGALYYAGLLDRPRAQLDYYKAGGGSSALVYAISDEGARALAQHRPQVNRGRLDWSRRNHQAGRLFLNHTLAVTDFAVALIAAVRKHPGITLAHYGSLLATLPPETRGRDEPFKWSVSCKIDGQEETIGLIPDHAFILTFPDGTRRCLLVEIDRGSMPVERAKLRQTSILRKLLAYHQGFKQKHHVEQFGWKAFRTLIVTTSKDRARNIFALVAQNETEEKSSRPTLARHLKDHDARIFYVTDEASLYGASDLLTHTWLSTDARPQLLPVNTLFAKVPSRMA